MLYSRLSYTCIIAKCRYLLPLERRMGLTRNTKQNTEQPGFRRGSKVEVQAKAISF